jgi:hypothetical protein
MLPIISTAIKALVVPWQSFWARQHGGGTVGTWLSNLPIDLGRVVSTLLFALPIALCVLHFGWLYFVIALAWSSLLFNTGHATAYEMGSDPAVAQSGRMETLSYIINPICNLLGIELGGTLFCWIYMTTKGLLFSLPLLKFAPLAAILYTCGYALGYKVPLPASWQTFSSEWYSGALVGLVVLLVLCL